MYYWQRACCFQGSVLIFGSLSARNTLLDDVNRYFKLLFLIAHTFCNRAKAFEHFFK